MVMDESDTKTEVPSNSLRSNAKTTSLEVQMRTRVRDERVGPRYVLFCRNENTGQGNATCSNFGTAYVGHKSTMQDRNNGSSFTRGFVMSPCALWKTSREATENPTVVCQALNGNGTMARRTFSGDFAGYFAFGFPNWPQVSMEHAKALALIEAYAKMNESPTLGGEQLATMKETIGMIRSPFASATKLANKFWKSLAKRKRLAQRDYIRDIRRLRKQKASKDAIAKRAARLAEELAKAAADVRLEFRYGVMPLLFDCEAHIGYITQKLRQQESHGEMRVARSKRHSGEAMSEYNGPVGCGLDFVYEPTVQVTKVVTSQVNAGVAYRVTPMSNAEQLMGHLGLRLRDIPVTAYALIPLSFVVDWAFNVEQWLQAIVPAPGVQPLGNWVTTIERGSFTVGSVRFHTILGYGTNHRVDVTFPGANEETFSYIRNVDTSLSTTPLFLGKPLSNTHIGDAAALSVNKFIGAVKRLL